jgi:phage shock protein PspC (stress-responsive transcriptional regulator)
MNRQDKIVYGVLGGLALIGYATWGLSLVMIHVFGQK